MPGPKPFGNDIRKQMQDCDRALQWLGDDVAMSDVLHTQGLRVHHATQLLIRARAVMEQSFQRFSANCVRWPNRPKVFPLFEMGAIKGILAVSGEDELQAKLVRANLVVAASGSDDAGSGAGAGHNAEVTEPTAEGEVGHTRVCLKRDFPLVWDQLLKVCTAGTEQGTRWRALKSLTDQLKHGAALEVRLIAVAVARVCLRVCVCACVS